MTSLATFDLDATGAPGFNWYLDQPFGYANLTASDVTLLPGGGVQILANQINELGVCTYSTKGATGFMYQHGYVQAVVSFNPALGQTAAGWPAFWGLAVEHLNGTNDTEWAEFDYFEACTGGYSAYDGEFVATLHDWNDDTNYESVPGNDIAVSVNWNNQQTLGALWAPGVVQWYLNNTLLRTVTFSATGVPNDGASPPNPPGTYWIMESQHLPLILGGGGAGWPLNVYSVAAWT